RSSSLARCRTTLSQRSPLTSLPGRSTPPASCRSPPWAGHTPACRSAPPRSPTAASASCSSTPQPRETHGWTVRGMPRTATPPVGCTRTSRISSSTTGPRPITPRTTLGWSRSRTPTTRTGSSASRNPSEPASKEHTMGKVYSAHSVSVDGYITGRGPAPGRGLGDGTMLFDWYFDGDTPSRVFDGFRLSEPSAKFFDALAGRDGAIVAGRNTYEDSDRFGGGSPHPDAPLFVVSHRPAPEITERQTLVTTGIEDAIAAARKVAGDRKSDV